MKELPPKKRSVGRPIVKDNLKRKVRSIKIRDDVYQKLHNLGSGSYAKGIEFLVYTYTEILDPDDIEESEEDESCTDQGNGETRRVD